MKLYWFLILHLEKYIWFLILILINWLVLVSNLNHRAAREIWCEPRQPKFEFQIRDANASLGSKKIGGFETATESSRRIQTTHCRKISQLTLKRSSKTTVQWAAGWALPTPSYLLFWSWWGKDQQHVQTLAPAMDTAAQTTCVSGEYPQLFFKVLVAALDWCSLDLVSGRFKSCFSLSNWTLPLLYQ